MFGGRAGRRPRPMRRRSIIGALLVCVVVPALVGFVAGSAGTGPGSLDGSFGKGGKATIDFGGNEAGFAVALQPDGKIVVAGRANRGAKSDFGVARFKPNGAADSSFGLNGHTAADFGGDFEEADAVVVQLDGKIVVAGSTSKVTNAFAVARIDPNGLFDKSFGTGGRVTVAFGASDGANAVALRPDGKIVVAGFTSTNTTVYDFAVAQLNRDGSLDSSFGVGGKSSADFGGFDFARAVAVQPDGKIVVAGYTSKGIVDADRDFAVARIKTNGYFDNSFGTDGKVTVDFGGNDTALAVALRPDGKIVVAGTTGKGAGYDFALARINADGTIDSSFGAGGKTTPSLGLKEEATAVALQPDGKIVVAGDTLKGPPGDDFVVARFNPNGLYDRSFGRGGRMTVDFGGNESGNGMVLQPDGKIVVAGTTSKGATGYHFAVARLLGGPTAKALTAKIVSATVLGHGQGRTLDVKISVSKAAKVQLRLLKQGSARLQKSFTVKAGVNELKASLPSTLQKGAYKLEITLRDANGQRKTYRADVALPA
jgi:uncharacterized delta-60 repeat protein